MSCHKKPVVIVAATTPIRRLPIVARHWVYATSAAFRFLAQIQSNRTVSSTVERLIADTEAPTDLGDFLAAFDLVEGVDDLFVAAAFAGHCVPSPWPVSPARLGHPDRSFFTFPRY
jgi:hypothetical protein